MTYANELSEPLLAAQTTNNGAAATFVDIYAGNVAPLNPPLVIPANYLKTGTMLKTTAFGTYSVTSATTPTLTFELTLGATPTVLALAFAFTAGSGVTTLPWKWETLTVIRDTGTTSTGLAVTYGTLIYHTVAVNTNPALMASIPQTAIAPVAIDTTVASTFTLRAAYSAQATTNIIVLHGFSVEELTQI
jgi:hypothetical protein